MKKIGKFVGPVLLAIIMLLAVRGLLVTHMRLPEASALHETRQWRHVWVSLTYYGLRLPGEKLWGFHRLGYRVPEVGDAVLFTLPTNKEKANSCTQSAGICTAVPSDTVWIDSVRQCILPGCTSPDAFPIVTPGRNMQLAVNSHNARLLAYLMQTFEKCPARIDAQNRLCINNIPQRYVMLAHDYYWVETLPNTYVIIPHNSLIGKIFPMNCGKKK